MSNIKQKVLIVDDSAMNRALLESMLEDQFEIVERENGAEAVELLREQASEFSVLLLDIQMPVLDGFGVLESMRRNKWIEDLPVIMISSETGSSFIEQAYELGATDYISRPFDEAVVRRRIENTILLSARQRQLTEIVVDQIREKRKSDQMMISILAHSVEFRNGESGQHVIHIRALTRLLLQRLLQRTQQYPLTPEDITLISTASALHDVGKLSIPDEVLNKPGRYTEEEYAVMKQHAAAGAEMIRALPYDPNEPLLKISYEICRWHHERYDGKGYPDGLQGDAIPIAAQVVAMADVYDALTSERCYKKAFSHEQAMEMILGGQCGAFNPLLLDCLEDIGPELKHSLSDPNWAEQDDEQDDAITQQLHKYGLYSTERRLLEQEYTRQRLHFVLDYANDIFCSYMPQDETLTLNTCGAAQLGLRTMIEHPLRDPALLACVEEASLARFLETVRAVYDHTRSDFRCEMTLICGGTPCRFHCDGRAVWVGSEERCVGLIMKLSPAEDRAGDAERARLSRTISNYHKEVYTDPVTGIQNRRYYDDHLRGMTEVDAVAMMDVNEFKHINDTYGHLVGDQVLRKIAEVLQRSVRRSDAVVRFGGDEFVAVFPDIPETKFRDKLQELETAVREAALPDHPALRVSISVGGVYGPGRVSHMIGKADDLMYRAKRGKDDIVITTVVEGGETS